MCPWSCSWVLVKEAVWWKEGRESQLSGQMEMRGTDSCFSFSFPFSSFPTLSLLFHRPPFLFSRLFPLSFLPTRQVTKSYHFQWDNVITIHYMCHSTDNYKLNQFVSFLCHFIFPFIFYWRTHSSIFAWRIPWTEEPSGLQSMGWQSVRHDWSDLAHGWHTIWY